MRHAVLGAGNLGMSLQLELKRHDHSVAMFTRSMGFDVTNPEHRARILSEHFDVIWNCIGGGSVAEAKADPAKAALIHHDVPLALANGLRDETKLVLFSTDYAAAEHQPNRAAFRTDSPRSIYAALKCEMENSVMALRRTNVTIVRVGSLFGPFHPDRTLPGKIIKNFGFSTGLIRLPDNEITPTPTIWLANELVESLTDLFGSQHCSIHHAAPNGNISVKDFGRFVLKGLRDGADFNSATYVDQERPEFSALGCSFDRVPHWFPIFQHYFRLPQFTPRERLSMLPADTLASAL